MKPSEYYDLLEAHDWYHMMSDSLKVDRAGEENRKKLVRLASDSRELMFLFSSYHDFVWNKTPKPERPTDPS